MFTINNVEWVIEMVQGNHPVLRRSDGSYSIGSCDYNEQVIYLRADLSDELLQKVLCHEVTHAAMFSYHVDLTLDQEELLADLIATYGQEIIDITNRIFLRMAQR